MRQASCVFLPCGARGWVGARRAPACTGGPHGGPFFSFSVFSFFYPKQRSIYKLGFKLSYVKIIFDKLYIKVMRKIYPKKEVM